MAELLPEPLGALGLVGSLSPGVLGSLVGGAGGVVVGEGSDVEVVGSGVDGSVMGGRVLSPPDVGLVPVGRVGCEEFPEVPDDEGLRGGVMTVVVVSPSGPTLTTVVGDVVEGGSVPVTATPSIMIVVCSGIAWPGTSCGPFWLPVSCEAVLFTSFTAPVSAVLPAPPVTCATAPNAVASTRPLAASAM
ncbi:hypothetical protein ABZ863_07400 [Saccharomonospora sp. NPDC046836]|uniref:hypothetical protein n=1 Tax=Saccharomonospora sp. NPDC046836 TaxID=3156921 RepID=UPI0033FCB954